ncbi:hypothetical protein L9F63_021095, partial [Diploptera punctata]
LDIKLLKPTRIILYILRINYQRSRGNYMLRPSRTSKLLFLSLSRPLTNIAFTSKMLFTTQLSAAYTVYIYKLYLNLIIMFKTIQIIIHAILYVKYYFFIDYKRKS